MNTLYSTLLKIGAFLLGLFAFWKWGQTSAKLKTAQKEVKNVIKQSKKLEDNNAIPYVDDAAMCLYDESEDDTTPLPEDAKEISDKAL